MPQVKQSAKGKRPNKRLLARPLGAAASKAGRGSSAALFVLSARLGRLDMQRSFNC
jgi:hypothetical protein